MKIFSLSQRAVQRLTNSIHDLFGPDQATGTVGIGCALALSLILLSAAAGFVWSKAYCSHDADSILPSLISTQKLTWYFWTQNRFGNVLPFLAAPISDVNANFTAQVFLRTGMAMSIPWLVFLYLRDYSLFVAKYLFALVLIFISMNIVPIWLQYTPFGASAFFFVGALASHHINRYSVSLRDLGVSLISFLCLVLAFFINSSLFVLTFPLWLGYAIIYPNRHNMWFLVFLLTAFGLCTLHSTLTPGANYFLLNLSWSNFMRMGSGLAVDLSWKAYLTELVLVFVCMVVLQSRQRQVNRAEGGTVNFVVARSILIFLALISYFIVVINLEWTRVNDFSTRYVLLVFAIFPALAAALAITTLSALIPLGTKMRAGLTLAITLLFFGVLIYRVGVPSWNCPGVDASRRANVEALSKLAVKYSASFIAGNYWTVWPTVFDVMKSRQVGGQRNPIFGLTGRSEVLSAEVAEYLRQSQDATIICAESEIAECYQWAIRTNNGYWPKFASILDRGLLPEVDPETKINTYLVIYLHRDKPSDSNALSPIDYQNQILFEDLRVRKGAKKESSGIFIPANGSDLNVYGPYAQMAPGKYQIRLRVSTKGAPADLDAAIFKFDVINASQTYYEREIRRRDLVPSPLGDWAVVNFTLPATLPSVNAIEFRVWSLGEGDLVLSAIELTGAEPAANQSKTN